MGKIRSQERWLVSDELWNKIEPLLPKPRRRARWRGGRPRVPDRNAMNGILFVLRTGCQWNALNATGICSSSTAHLRFQQWTQVGVFARLWEHGLTKYDELQGIDWHWQAMDGAMTKAPLGGEKKRAQSHGSRQEGSQAQRVDGRQWRADRTGGGRSQPQ